MTRVKIDHYLEVDFTSFMKTVDVARRGARSAPPRPLKDTYTGPEPAGRHPRLDGGQALQYVRSRHLDGGSDLGRMQRQQRFLAALIEQATSSGVLLNPVKFEAGRLDRARLRARRQGLRQRRRCWSSAGRCGGFTPASSEFASVPVGNSSHPSKGIGSTVKWDERKAEKLFRDAPRGPADSGDRRDTERAKGSGRDGEAGKASPGDGGRPREQIRVQVENGTTNGRARPPGRRALRRHGLQHDGRRRHRAGDRRPAHHVTYDPRWDRSAQSLATALPGARTGRGARAAGR